MDSPSPAPRVVPLPWRRSGTTPTTAPPAPERTSPAAPPPPSSEDQLRASIRAQLLTWAGPDVARQVALGGNQRRRRLIERCIRIGIDLSFWPALGCGLVLGLWWGMWAGMALVRWGASS